RLARRALPQPAQRPAVDPREVAGGRRGHRQGGLTVAIELMWSASVPSDVDAVGIGVTSDAVSTADVAPAFLEASGFEGKRGQLVQVPGHGEPDRLVVGLGDP